jgi:NADPH:quinone reductase-like Zn-dependent oxidoreductase
VQAIVIEQLGGPEVLTIRHVPDPKPGPGEVLVDITVAGVNFMDTGARQHGPAGGTVPFVPGVEAAGVVRALGSGVTGFSVGDRVAWVYSYGSYAEKIVVPAASLVRLPEDVSDEVAASVMMQGITAHHFTTEAYPVEAGDVLLVHAAAGGLGRLITQIAKLRGAEVIGVVSREEKVVVAKDAGADHVIVSTGEAFVADVLRLTGGDGVRAVFDGNGESTFRASMRVLRRNGTLLYYGAFIGEVPTIGMRELPRSIKICYPTFRDHIATREELLAHSADLFTMITSGKLDVVVGGRYPLADACRAHHDLESRRTTGKLLLLVGAMSSTKD